MTFPQPIDKVSLEKSLNPMVQLRLKLTQCRRSILLFIGFSCLLLNLWGCSGATAPREFAPDGPVIQQAIATKLQGHYQQLSRTLAALPPTLDLKNVQIKKLDSFFLAGLPVYHFQGSYDLTLTFPSERLETRQGNSFEIYLQRQKEGKTWRSLEKNGQGWRSYSLP